MAVNNLADIPTKTINIADGHTVIIQKSVSVYISYAKDA